MPRDAKIDTEEGSTEDGCGGKFSMTVADREERRSEVEEGWDDLPDDRREDLEEDRLTLEADNTGKLC